MEWKFIIWVLVGVLVAISLVFFAYQLSLNMTPVMVGQGP